MQDQKGNIGVIVSFIIVAGLIGFIIYSLMHQTTKINPLDGMKIDTTKISEPKSATDNEATPQTQNNMEPNKNVRLLKDFTPVASTPKLDIKDTVAGTGAEVKAGATVTVHYTGAVAATGAIFQSSKDGGTPVTFPLTQVIKGWTDGIPGMKVGGTRRLIIPAALAYGSTPPSGSGIPANADLVFDVDLISIQ
jgi:FKBP-type peptidyl-prolyl cis-trans isomerase